MAIFFSAVVLAQGGLQAQTSLFDPNFRMGSGPDGSINAILVLHDGKILVGGSFTNISDQPCPYLARLHPNGTLDNSFVSDTDGVVNRLLQLEDGKILVGGEFQRLQGAGRQKLGRLLSDGTVDLSFDANSAYDADESVLAIAVQQDNKILTGTDKTISYTRFTRLSRLHQGGELDASFNRNIATYAIYALLPLPSGNILVGGGFPGSGFGGYHGLAMVDCHGTIDTNFPELLSDSKSSTIFSLIQLTNGNILVGGSLNPKGAVRTKALAQLTPVWQWDPGFDPGPFDGSLEAGYVRTALVQPDGKFVVTGEFYRVQGYWRRHVARLDASGAIDSCFDPTLGLGGWDGGRALARQADGRVLVGGNFDNSLWVGYSNLARLEPQTDCNMIRTYVLKEHAEKNLQVLGCCPPGGTNHMQMSTNTIDWIDLLTTTDTYLYWVHSSEEPRVFFRVWKEQ